MDQIPLMTGSSTRGKSSVVGRCCGGRWVSEGSVCYWLLPKRLISGLLYRKCVIIMGMHWLRRKIVVLADDLMPPGTELLLWLTHCGLVTVCGVTIGSGNYLLPGSTKSLPEPMLTYHKWNPVTFLDRYLSHQSWKLAWKSLNKIFIQISQGPMS